MRVVCLAKDRIESIASPSYNLWQPIYRRRLSLSLSLFVYYKINLVQFGHLPSLILIESEIVLKL